MGERKSVTQKELLAAVDRLGWWDGDLIGPSFDGPESVHWLAVTPRDLAQRIFDALPATPAASGDVERRLVAAWDEAVTAALVGDYPPPPAAFGPLADIIAEIRARLAEADRG